MSSTPADLAASPLGRSTVYRDAYDPALLFAVDRATRRRDLGIAEQLPFDGDDVWNAYELSWLDTTGKPIVATARLRVPCGSPAIVESKSLKLYLTAFNQTAFSGADEVRATMVRDIRGAVGAPVDVDVEAVPDLPATSDRPPSHEVEVGTAVCLDHQPLSTEPARTSTWRRDPEALTTSAAAVRERLYTRLFRSLCPVTGQPDYATVHVAYSGPRIDRAELLRYLVSYRNEPGFHEHCVESIFVDLMRRCRPDALQVEARFTRRGGIDINPCRITPGAARIHWPRDPRQ